MQADYVRETGEWETTTENRATLTRIAVNLLNRYARKHKCGTKKARMMANQSPDDGYDILLGGTDLTYESGDVVTIKKDGEGPRTFSGDAIEDITDIPSP